MKRSFNFTGNRKLDGYFVASFDDSQNPLAVRASIDTRWLNELKTLDPNLEVAIAVSDVLRFDYRIGTLGEVIAANGFAVVLKDFTLEGVEPQIDLRMVDLNTKKIEASAVDLVPSVSPGAGRRSFVKLSISHAIGKEVWRVRWSASESIPVLQLNATIPDATRKFTESSQLGTVVIPQVLRQILMIMLMCKYDEGTSMQAERAEVILHFCQKLEKSDPPPLESRDFEDVAAWVDLVVAKFAARIEATDRFHYPPEPSTPLQS